jgi:hypothetical protein
MKKTNLLIASLITAYYEKNKILPFTALESDEDTDVISFDVQSDFIDEFKKHSTKNFNKSFEDFVNETLEKTLKDIKDGIEL